MVFSSFWKFLKRVMSKLPLERGVTTDQREIYDEYGGFDSGVHQELEVAAVFLVTFVTADKSNWYSEAKPCDQTYFSRGQTLDRGDFYK